MHATPKTLGPQKTTPPFRTPTPHTDTFKMMMARALFAAAIAFSARAQILGENRASVAFYAQENCVTNGVAPAITSFTRE